LRGSNVCGFYKRFRKLSRFSSNENGPWRWF